MFFPGGGGGAIMTLMLSYQRKPGGGVEVGVASHDWSLSKIHIHICSILNLFPLHCSTAKSAYYFTDTGLTLIGLDFRKCLKVLHQVFHSI